MRELYHVLLCNTRGYFFGDTVLDRALNLMSCAAPIRSSATIGSLLAFQERPSLVTNKSVPEWKGTKFSLQEVVTVLHTIHVITRLNIEAPKPTE
jgi:hypothetical protein